MQQGFIDILASDISQVGQSDFTANSAVNDVAVNNTAANGLVFADPAGRAYFKLGDSFLLQKIWAVINWGFGQGGPTITGAHNIGLAFWDGAAMTPMYPFFDAVRSLNIPTLCDPVDFGDGTFVPMPTAGVRRQIRLNNIDLRVSQINLPAALNAQRITVQYFVQVLHTYHMELLP